VVGRGSLSERLLLLLLLLLLLQLTCHMHHQWMVGW
jgi:hypothetical protein